MKYRISGITKMEFAYRSDSNYIEVTKYYIEEKHWLWGWVTTSNYYYSEEEAREAINVLEYVPKKTIINL